MISKKIKVFFISQLFLLLVASFSIVKADDAGGNINVLSESSSNRIAPGDFLPVSVKLVNFGLKKRIDVIINYKIFNNAEKDVHLQKEVYSESETVAVETTASFVKRIQVPYNFKPGLYTLVTILNYPYQEDPAVSKTPFLVEEKFGNFFKSDLMIYSLFLLLVLVVVVLVTIVLIYLFGRRRKIDRNVMQFDYSSKPKGEMVYYEMLSDIIYQMRLHIGDKAIKIAKESPDLEIDEKTGMIINIKQEPAKIISLLLAQYESITGQPISFNVGKSKKNNI